MRSELVERNKILSWRCKPTTNAVDHWSPLLRLYYWGVWDWIRHRLTMFLPRKKHVQEVWRSKSLERVTA